MDGKGGWETRGGVRSSDVQPSSKAWSGTHSRGVVARGEDSRKEVGGNTG